MKISQESKMRAELELVARILQRSGALDTLPSLPMRILRHYLPDTDKRQRSEFTRHDIIPFPTPKLEIVQ